MTLVAQELAKYQLDLMGVQEVRLDGNGISPIGVIPRQTEQFLTFMSPIFMKLFTGILQTKIYIQLIFLSFQSIILVVKKYLNL